MHQNQRGMGRRGELRLQPRRVLMGSRDLHPAPLTTHWPAVPEGLSTARQLGAVGELQAQSAVLQFCAAVQVWMVLSCWRVSCRTSPVIVTSASSVRLPEPVSSAEMMNSSLFCCRRAGSWAGLTGRRC